MSSPSELPVPGPSAANLEFVEKLYYEYLRDPSAVDDRWRSYFDGLPASPGTAPAPASFPRRRADGAAGPRAAGPDAAFQAKVEKLVQAYREYGHLRARLDPLGLVRRDAPFRLEDFGIAPGDLDRSCTDTDGTSTVPLRDIVARLEETYCRTLGVELAHMHDRDLRTWIEQRMERTRNHVALDAPAQKRLYRAIARAEMFEQFVGTKFLGAKRFSVEGAEGLLPLFDFLVDRAMGHGLRNVVIGMAHRGRLNVLANVVDKPLRDIFGEFRDQAIIAGSGGDVKYHLGYSTDRKTPDGVLVHLSLSFNPSHLEWIDTVVQGRVRAKQDRYQDPEGIRSMPVLVHGDAAFAGQGIVAESLNMSQLDAYSVGGTIHVIVNNQVGFTTSPKDARSTTYATGPARMLQIPILHVNGEDVEAVAQAVLIALDFRQRFHRDVVIDLWTYRRHGHNEGDEPSFTQPVMYRAIAARPTLRQLYADQLVAEGTMTREEVDAVARAYRAELEEAHRVSSRVAIQPGAQSMEGFWEGYRGGPITGEPEPHTAVAREEIAQVAAALVQVPQGFNLHPKLVKLLEGRAQMGRGERPVDWAMGEALALGTLAWNGARVRLVGQDAGRGTFSHRHAVLHDHQTGATYLPLGHLRDRQGPVEVRDSLLSEAAALGFEYGYSLDMPDALTVWEAQFGDFVNAAQVIVDQFLSSGEAKWNRLSGLVLLLPHGMEGQGPEHSSARLERFLELSVDDNWRVVNLTTPAQLFHALRRQAISPWRKPLVVMAPKSLLRHPAAVSPLEEFTQGRFQAVLPDPGPADPKEITRVVLCSGKLYYDLVAGREAQGARHAAIVRIEQLYPLSPAEVAAEVRRHGSDVEVVWAQEEPSNMGAWDYVALHLGPHLPGPLVRVARQPSASPAVGSLTRHKLEQEQIVLEALGQPAPKRRRAGVGAAVEER